MNHVLGELVAPMLGVVISPIPLVAVILILLTSRPLAMGLAFAVGWLTGLTVATAAFLVIFSSSAVSGTVGSTGGGSAALCVVGALLLGFAGYRWHRRARVGDATRAPAWVHAVDNLTARRASMLGFGLAALNPENLAMCAGAAVVLVRGDLTGATAAVCFVGFVLLAGSTVLVPIAVFAIAPMRAQGPLDRLRRWLESHTDAIVVALLLVIGLALVGKGVGAY